MRRMPTRFAAESLNPTTESLCTAETLSCRLKARERATSTHSRHGHEATNLIGGCYIVKKFIPCHFMMIVMILAIPTPENEY